MMEKLRMFFINWRKAWANLRLYRSAMVIQGFQQLCPVQPSVAHQLTGEEKHRHLVAVSDARHRISVHITHLDGMIPRGRLRVQLREQLLAEMASGPRVEHETHPEAALRITGADSGRAI
jgi:hypothetical protein